MSENSLNQAGKVGRASGSRSVRGTVSDVRIKAMSVFEGIVYHSACVDPANPLRPTLEVDAVVRDGDVDAGPVLLPWPDFVFMVGTEIAGQCYREFDRQGRIVDHLGVPHLAFHLWTPGELTLVIADAEDG